MSDPKAAGLFVGRSTLDLVYACDRFPDADGKVDAQASYVSGGGPALNAAVAFAALGGRARLCSPIGRGVQADQVRQDLEAHAVELLDAAAGQADVLPSSCIILTGASRAVVTPPPPPRGRELDAEAVDAMFAARPDVVLSDGHVPELAGPILRRAREAGIPTVLDGGSWKPWTAELMPHIDVAIVSSRFLPPGARTPAEVLDALAQSLAAVALTRGPEPILWRAGQLSGEITPPKVRAVDTLGAGDIFHGAFCHAFAGRRDFAFSLKAAAAVAARACESLGPRAWIGPAG